MTLLKLKGECNKMDTISPEELKSFKSRFENMEKTIGSRVIGSERVVRFMLISMLSSNHILLEGVPGLAKTMLANEFSKSMSLEFKRIQFTPDMLPSDITGSYVINLETKKMEFRSGPVFTNVLLADEINRTPPKVQSALLESMEERQVSVAGERFNLPHPFLVIATQNPIEQEGTFPLAEALMDRFLFRYQLRYPTREQELVILNDRPDGNSPRTPFLNSEDVLNMRKQIENVHVTQEVRAYIVDIIRRTRESGEVFMGASPRTSVKYLRAARANALLSGRDYVMHDDVKYMAYEILNHRLILKPDVTFEDGRTEDELLKGLIDSIVQGVEIG